MGNQKGACKPARYLIRRMEMEFLSMIVALIKKEKSFLMLQCKYVFRTFCISTLYVILHCNLTAEDKRSIKTGVLPFFPSFVLSYQF